MRSLLLAATLAILPLAAAGVPPLHLYEGIDQECRVGAEVSPRDAFDPSAGIHMILVVAEPDHVLRDGSFPACGTTTGTWHCSTTLGSYEDGFSCLGYRGNLQASTGGVRGAPEVAPGVHRVPMTYFGHAFEATATSIG